eukprot:CAMPEP_0173384742 /NCGR_PEP_ID=MMETSP1356-20130122/7326_1 /TAXON_ID=77927 ORGANISM="Hemiselmis virescens, Strain PCC157" /NCGR_SAMPLE_ID=MMETSP1356 /ASSEMBLY_ACC=CAM_ASM_000847 /LENGTH=42 /DNA_ID= /DNA_START= /DNA_END= /DNA_ORIENTATION=
MHNVMTRVTVLFKAGSAACGSALLLSSPPFLAVEWVGKRGLN